MDKEEAIRILSEKWPTSEDLRREHPDISHLLQGDFAFEEDGSCYRFNVYPFPGGFIVSRPLDQGKIDDPTVGAVFPGEYSLHTGRNTETIIVLEGILTAGVDDGQRSILEKYEKIIAPAGSFLKLGAEKTAFYLCQYERKE